MFSSRHHRFKILFQTVFTRRLPPRLDRNVEAHATCQERLHTHTHTLTHTHKRTRTDTLAAPVQLAITARVQRVGMKLENIDRKVFVRNDHFAYVHFYALAYVDLYIGSCSAPKLRTERT